MRRVNWPVFWSHALKWAGAAVAAVQGGIAVAQSINPALDVRSSLIAAIPHRWQPVATVAVGIVVFVAAKLPKASGPVTGGDQGAVRPAQSPADPGE